MATILSILNFFFILFLVTLLFNAIIIAHELGHFLAAKWRGLKVEEFGVWFGKPLWKKEINGVVYSLGSIPAGGFVKLPQLAPMEALEGESAIPRDQLPPISTNDKIIVSFAGPLFSFLCAVVMAVGVYFVGKPVSEVEKTTVIGYVQPGGPADQAGLRAGDKILAVDGHPVNRFAGMTNSVMWYILRSSGETIPFKVQRGHETLTLESKWIIAPSKPWQRANLRQVQIGPAQTAHIKSVIPDSPAAKAGLKPGDIITAVNGNPIYTPAALSLTIEKAPDQPVALTVKRTGETLHFEIRPETLPAEEGAPRPLIGVAWDFPMTLDHPAPWQQIVESASAIGNTFSALFSKKGDIGPQHLMGPVGIVQQFFMLFESENGWRKVLWFAVVLNVNLAILNLLPFPVLDGGHIVIAIIEKIRRKPVSLKILEPLQTLCALLLIAFIAYVTFFDVQDIPWLKWFR